MSDDRHPDDGLDLAELLERLARQADNILARAYTHPDYVAGAALHLANRLRGRARLARDAADEQPDLG